MRPASVLWLQCSLQVWAIAFQLDVGRVAAERSENGPGWSAFPPARGKAALGGSAAPARRRPSDEAGRSPVGTRRASPLPGARTPAARRPPARWRRWPGLSRRTRPSRSSDRPPIQIFLQRADGLGPDAEIGDRRQHALGHRVHHARLRQHVDQPQAATTEEGRQRSVAHRRRPRSARPRRRPAARGRSARLARDPTRLGSSSPRRRRR